MVEWGWCSKLGKRWLMKILIYCNMIWFGYVQLISQSQDHSITLNQTAIDGRQFHVTQWLVEKHSLLLTLVPFWGELRWQEIKCWKVMEGSHDILLPWLVPFALACMHCMHSCRSYVYIHIPACMDTSMCTCTHYVCIQIHMLYTCMCKSKWSGHVRTEAYLHIHTGIHTRTSSRHTYIQERAHTSHNIYIYWLYCNVLY